MTRKILFILTCLSFFIISCHSLLLAQEDNSARKAAGLSQQPPAEQSKSVTAIEIKGNKLISTNTIISKMKTRVGNIYQENVVSDDLKRLYLLNFFSDIKVDTESYKDGIKVVLTVKERPLIEKIVFQGVWRLRMGELKLKEQLKSKEAQYLDYPSLTEDAETLRKLYEKIGYSEAEVNYKVDVGPETGKATVAFSVEENKRVQIKDIILEGNFHYSDRKILRLMKTRKAWFFNPGVLKEEVLQEDMERVKAFYHREGFADVELNYEVKAGARASSLYITIKVKEGNKYLVGNVTISGNKEIQEDVILSRLKDCVPGKVFSQEAMGQDVDGMRALYFDRGYIFVDVQEATSLNPDTQRIDIVYNIIENEIAYVDRIKIKGNIKTKDVVIRRELRIKPGERFDGDKLRRSKERLQNLGYFEDVSYDTEDTKTPDKKDLVVEVKETKTGSFSFGGGYSTVDQLIGFVEVEQKNFDWKNFPYFTGDGQDLKIRGSFGTLSSNSIISWTEPWLFDYPISFGFDGYKSERKRESDVGYGYDEAVFGGDLRLGKEIKEYLRADLRYRYDNIDISNFSDNASNDLLKEYGENSISSMEFGLTFDNRDSIYDPTRGDVLSGSLEGAGGPLGGDKDFWKFIGRASHYFPLPRKSSLELRGRVSVAEAYGDSEALPIYERFFAGGANTVRGYNERKLGPIDPVSKDPLGGESMLVGNIEYVYPLFDFMKIAAFYDVGNAWSKMSDLGSGGLKSSFGLGVRLKTPVGPLMLDYGIPLNKEPGEDRRSSGKLHFSMSQGF